jgi:CsoR family transcriptional regulator, copper-sensing transcriptional repressor
MSESTPGYHPRKQALIARMRRIEGQVRGIERMISEDRYCIDVLTQIAAVSTALESVALEVLDRHVESCVSDALSAGDQQQAQEKSAELLQAVRRFTRTR